MAKNGFISRSKKSWGFPNWKANCPDFTFKVVPPGQYPEFIPSSLSEKYNSGYLASSGTTGMHNGIETDFYIGLFVGLRYDKGELDEQQYVSVYDQKNGNLLFDGYLQHQVYENRTTSLTKEQIQIIISSGITANIKTNRLPEINEGHLNYLAENNIITGLEVSAIKAMEELRHKNNP